MSEPRDLFPFLWAFGFLPALGTALFWIGSRLSGWARLGDHYRLQRDFPMPRLRFQTVSLRYRMDYGNVAEFAADDQALYLRPFWPFRPFHPPLRLPWGDLQRGQWRRFRRSGVELRARRAAHVPIRISANVDGWLAARRGKPGGPATKPRRA